MLSVGSKPYPIEVDEGGSGGFQDPAATNAPAACNAGMTPFPLGQVYDISNEASPRLVFELRFETHRIRRTCTGAGAARAMMRADQHERWNDDYLRRGDKGGDRRVCRTGFLHGGASDARRGRLRPRNRPVDLALHRRARRRRGRCGIRRVARAGPGNPGIRAVRRWGSPGNPGILRRDRRSTGLDGPAAQ
ncbi:hypothetical protein BCEP4_1230011 [Burkholderia cepacia]|nr:hypothetical protein BCEP4_1230011 [Burkholderia cepacia]